ncbi:hypothetical protein D3C75_1096390 [compost metagenome]
MGFLEQHDGQGPDDEDNHRVGQAREQPHAEGDFFTTRHALLAHAQLRNRDDQIHQQCNGAGAGQQEIKHRSRRHVVGEYRQKGRTGRQHHRPVRCTALVGALGNGRRITTLAQREHHP